MVFTDVISSILSGGATGLIGAIVSRYADYKNKEQEIEITNLKNAHEVELRKIDVEIAKSEWAARENIAITEADSKIDVADSQSFQAAILSESQHYANTSKLTRAQNSFMVFVDGTRGLIRPLLTLCFFILMTQIYVESTKLIKDQPVSIEQAVDIYTQITATILYLSTTCTLFWFGARQKDQSINKKR